MREGQWVEARQSWPCTCPCGCVRIVPATEKYWLDSATNRRHCYACATGCRGAAHV